MALGLRTVAIRQAREKELSGFVLTSNGTRGDLDRLAADAGGEIRVVQITSRKRARVSRRWSLPARGAMRARKGSSGAGLVAIGSLNTTSRLTHERRDTVRG